MQKLGKYKSTEFNETDINIIYNEAKNGNIKIERWILDDFYDLSHYVYYDKDGSIELTEKRIFNIIDSLNKHNYIKAQNLIYNYTKYMYKHLDKSKIYLIDTSYVF